MNFAEFIKLYQAYQAWTAAGQQGIPSTTPPAQTTQTAQTTPPAQTAQTAQTTPPAQTAQTDNGIEQRLALLEQRLMNPSMAGVEPMGLGDVFSRMLGETTEGGKK